MHWKPPAGAYATLKHTESHCPRKASISSEKTWTSPFGFTVEGGISRPGCPHLAPPGPGKQAHPLVCKEKSARTSLGSASRPSNVFIVYDCFDVQGTLAQAISEDGATVIHIYWGKHYTLLLISTEGASKQVWSADTKGWRRSGLQQMARGSDRGHERFVPRLSARRYLARRHCWDGG